MEGELELCIRREYARLVAAVSVAAGSPELAEEAVQEAFAKAWERTQRGEHFEHLAGWVATVALNQVRSGWRRRSAERRALDRLAQRRPIDPVDGPDVALAVREAVAGLRGRQRDAVVLYYLLDLNVAAAARLLGVSPGTIKTALSRARQKLAVVLDDEEVDG